MLRVRQEVEANMYNAVAPITFFTASRLRAFWADVAVLTKFVMFPLMLVVGMGVVYMIVKLVITTVKIGTKPSDQRVPYSKSSLSDDDDDYKRRT